MPLFTKHSLSLSYYHIEIGKQPLSRSEGTIMHPPVDFLRSQHTERSTVGLSVHWQPASTPCHVPRFVVGPTASQPCTFNNCSRHFLQSNTLFPTTVLCFVEILMPSLDHYGLTYLLHGTESFLRS